MTLADEFPLISVTDKPRAPKGGTLHDFTSMGPYWWTHAELNRETGKPEPLSDESLEELRKVLAHCGV